MSIYRRKDSPFCWVKLPPIRGESKPLQQSTGQVRQHDGQSCRRGPGVLIARHRVPDSGRSWMTHLAATCLTAVSSDGQLTGVSRTFLGMRGEVDLEVLTVGRSWQSIVRHCCSSA